MGAGFMIAGSPRQFQVLRPEVAYMQFDGDFDPQGEASRPFNLSSYLMTVLYSETLRSEAQWPTWDQLPNVIVDQFLRGAMQR